MGLLFSFYRQYHLSKVSKLLCWRIYRWTWVLHPEQHVYFLYHVVSHSEFCISRSPQPQSKCLTEFISLQLELGYFWTSPHSCLVVFLRWEKCGLVSFICQVFGLQVESDDNGGYNENSTEPHTDVPVCNTDIFVCNPANKLCWAWAHLLLNNVLSKKKKKRQQAPNGVT